MIDFLVNYWWIIIAAIAIISVVGVAIYTFIKLPIKIQKEKINAWLLYAVKRAEDELGSGTGPLKLRFVYDLFIKRFPFTAKIITFKRFSWMVDMALNEFQELLEAKPRLNGTIGGSENESN